MIDFNIIFSFAIAYLITFAFVPIIRVIAFKVNAVDIPADGRRMHKKPTPRMGGVAIFLGFIVSAACFTSVIDKELIGIFLGSLIIVIVGIFDDRKPLPAVYKLLGQIVAATVVIIFGVRINLFTNPFLVGNGYINLSFLSIPVTYAWIIIMTNAINLIDGLDGLATGISGISALALVFLCVIIAKADMAILLTGVAGACFGFLPFNQYPAKIFMGDSGALFLGFILSTLSIQGFFKSYAVITFIIPIIVLALPIFDTSYAILRRVAKKKHIMSPDRGHLHHRLIDYGFTQREAVTILSTFSALLSITAIILTTRGINRAMVLLFVIVLFVVSIRLYYKNKNIAKEYLKELNGNRGKIMGKIKVMTVFGTRPEAIKMAPLVKELEARDRVKSIVTVTAQHREMLDQVLKIFDITPDYDLDIMKQRQSLVDITLRAVEGLSEVIKNAMPDIVLVHGDTSTTFAGALAAFYNKAKVGHVEAGLRTYDKYSPYPEEMNRKLTGSIADFHFAPTIKNKENLLKEGVSDKDIFITGNTVIDALKTTVNKEYEFSTQKLKEVDFEKKVLVVTAHRRENLGKPLEDICAALSKIAKRYKDEIEIVYPMHLNPVVRETASRILGDDNNVYLIDPVDVCELHNLMDRSYMILTDSGGLQEEAPSLGKPVLVLRNETERPEAVSAGTVKIAGVKYEDIVNMSIDLIENKTSYEKMARAVNPYGDGLASKRIADVILKNCFI